MTFRTTRTRHTAVESIIWTTDPSHRSPRTWKPWTPSNAGKRRTTVESTIQCPSGGWAGRDLRERRSGRALGCTLRMRREGEVEVLPERTEGAVDARKAGGSRVAERSGGGVAMHASRAKGAGLMHAGGVRRGGLDARFRVRADRHMDGEQNHARTPRTSENTDKVMAPASYARPPVGKKQPTPSRGARADTPNAAAGRGRSRQAAVGSLDADSQNPRSEPAQLRRANRRRQPP